MPTGQWQRSFPGGMLSSAGVVQGSRAAPNNSFKPNLLRSGKNMAEKACHVFTSTTQVGLTQALGANGESIVPGWIAKRDLVYSPKGSIERFDLSICVHAPFELAEGSVNFEFRPGTAGCIVQTFGLPKDVTETVYGADSLQALELACAVDGLLRRFRKDFDLYFPDGEPYFED